MKTFLYIVGALIVLLIVGGFIAYQYVAKVPDLVIEEGATPEEKLEALDTWLADLHKKRKFNGGVLIAKEGKPQFMKTYGHTDHKKNEQLTTQSSFRLASLSKQFTCTGIMLLQQKDSLAYDDAVAQHLDGFPHADVTIRHLMNHTSGIPDNYEGLAHTYKSEIGDVLSIKEVSELVSKYPAEAKTPGDEYAYNNTGYVLLAAVIEQASGMSFEQFLQTELFDPLQMKNTRVWNLLSPDKTFPNKTSSFAMLGGDELKPDFIDGVAGDGAVFSSLEDLLIWDDFWVNADLLSDENRMEAFKTPTLNDGTASDYGFGWVVVNDGKFVTHTGAWLGARTYIGRNTENRNTLVVLDNGLNLLLDPIVNQIAQVFK